MKRTIFLLIAATLLFSGCTEKVGKTGSISGVVTDKATGEPVRAAGVQLNTGEKATTGNDGYYEFPELSAGEYTLQVTKTGYTDLLDYKIIVQSGQTTKGDVQIEKLPAALRIVNDKGENIDMLDFGSEASVVSRSFNIFNDSPETLEWIITKNCDWITEISKTTGTLQAGKQQPVVLTINREKLSAGNNTYILNISSDNGTKELTIKADGYILPTLNTHAVTDLTTKTALLNGEILTNGTPDYTERGFVYALSPMPTVETTIAKLTASLTSSKTYSVTVTGLTLGQTYYVRAYAVNKAGTAYSSNQVSFKPETSLPAVTTKAVTNIDGTTATFNGSITNIGDPAYTERGFVYAKTQNPEIENDTKVKVTGNGTGDFSANITALTVGTTYYVRAYATNSQGTAYGTQVSFKAEKPLSPFMFDNGNGIFKSMDEWWNIFFVSDNVSLPGTKTTRTIRIKNNLQESLYWEITNIPGDYWNYEGIELSEHSGYIDPNGIISIKLTFEYPDYYYSFYINLTNCIIQSTTYSSTRVWNWEYKFADRYVDNDGNTQQETCTACCWQKPMIKVGENSKFFSLVFNQWVVWSDGKSSTSSK